MSPQLLARVMSLRPLLGAVVLALVVAWSSGCGGLRVDVRPLTASSTSRAAVRLWPLLTVEPAPDARPDLEALGAPPRPGRVDVVWPFGAVRWHEDARGRRSTFWALHPILSRSSFPARAESDDRTTITEFIYPLVQVQRREVGGTARAKWIVFPVWLWQQVVRVVGTTELTAQRSYFFPFWWQGTDTLRSTGAAGAAPGAEPAAEPSAIPPELRRRFQYLLPFWWYNDGATHELPFFNPAGRRMLGLWPFFVFLDSYNGRTYRSFLWPLVVYSFADEDTQRALSIVWPIFRVQWGGEKEPIREVRAWPLFGWRWSGAKFSRYLLWPLFIWRDAGTPEEPDRSFVLFPFWISGDYKDGRYRIFFPFSGRYTDADEQATFVLWPLYARWQHDRDEFVEHQVLWHLIRWRTGTGEKPNTYRQVYPLYRYVETENVRRWHHPILLWHGTERRKGGYTFHGRYSYFTISWKTREFDDGYRDWSRIVAPFAHWKGNSDGERHVRVFWLLYEEALDGVRRNWTPLWAWFRHDRDLLRAEVGPFARPDSAIPRDLEFSDDLPPVGAVVGVVSDTELMGGLYRRYRAPGRRETHWNVGPFAYTMVDGERAFSMLGGWLPLRWGTPDPPAAPLAPPTRREGEGLGGWLDHIAK